MKNKKWWLFAKGLLLLLFIISVIITPSRDNTQLFTRTVMFIFFAITFGYDLNEFRKGR